MSFFGCCLKKNPSISGKLRVKTEKHLKVKLNRTEKCHRDYEWLKRQIFFRPNLVP